MAVPSAPAARAADVVFLSDSSGGIRLRHSQDWGDFGLDTAAARTGGVGTALQIGQKKFDKGLGHHANGEIVVDLRGQFTHFRSTLGVQWQGGNRGSVIFQVSVDGKLLVKAGPMSDSDPPQQIEVPVAGARELRLIASDAGDGIGCDMANWAEACLVRDPRVPSFDACAVSFGGEPAPPPSAAAGGFAMIARQTGPQVAVMETARKWSADIAPGEDVRLVVPVRNSVEPLRIACDVRCGGSSGAEVGLSLRDRQIRRTVSPGQRVELATEPVNVNTGAASEIELWARAVDGATGLSFSNLRYTVDSETFHVPLVFPQAKETIPPPVLPDPRPWIEQELIEWDWRMQDGIGTARESRSWEEAIGAVLDRGDRLIGHLAEAKVSLDGLAASWESLRARRQDLVAGKASDLEWETLWREIHLLRRRIALANPLAKVGPLVFVKCVPSGFSHQLTQYSGRRARPGGGVFVLDDPGQSMRCRQLGALPEGSYLHPDVSWDGRRVLFSFCKTDPAAIDWQTNEKQFYHLYEMAADGSDLRQLTDGAYDDFSPRYLPDGKILFVSTRRGGFHRCGRGPCPVYTMAVANADGSDPRVISFHETHEWDPAVLNDGRVIYTRWDYVDRHAVHYQQLWSVRPDGGGVSAYYGNNTLNPVGVWEARPIPGSSRVMATAAAHHAMTAGSIILLDVTKGIDGLDPITRLTPDALFPESEFPVQHWHATAGVPAPPAVPVEEKRWPGHCYRTAYPLSEDFFLAAYSFEPLIGEPLANPANMFGLYLVDRFGNKELIYRDASIGSLWPTPLRPRVRPPVLSSSLAEGRPGEGTFFLQNVYASWPLVAEGKGSVKRLRVLQVLPKTTPHANSPRVGLANASPGKQVLGTVPVEPDGSAWFRAPAGIPLSFQALDQRGMAIQTMRSLTYLQPGEQAGCIGCHEHRTSSPAAGMTALATRRGPSDITPGPQGSKPFNYAILVQPILDKHCVECHRPGKAEGGFDLSGAPAGEFTVSYNSLVALVPFSEWKGTPQANGEPLTEPERFGARASKLMRLLSEGHEKVSLSEEEYERLITWMDTNALFYGTFDPEDQQRQRRGEAIAGPALE
ncbi:MAG: NPCBM/NEW2 domain-containing protein [Pirellulales bacterium]|nr:NPCBM/NEW2 domain-containing protein [Pirellulales bacterium]